MESANIQIVLLTRYQCFGKVFRRVDSELILTFFN